MRFTALERYRALTSDRIDLASLVCKEQQSDYESAHVEINGERWHIRTARVTPTKPGAFVAFWRRALSGSTEPFSDDSDFAGLLVFVVDGAKFGVFRFTREHLQSRGITSAHSAPGKRGFRVYPSWCESLNPQATRTQRAQAAAFSDLTV